MSLETVLHAWRADPGIAAHIVAWQTVPARPARFAPYPVDVHPALVRALRDLGISALYTHQAAAWDCVQRGQNPVVVTGTASGKTLCYNLPILDRLLREPAARTLYLFPTKALAQDQLNTLRRLSAALPLAHDDKTAPDKGPIAAATYDGDTPSAARTAIREQANLILSNPDMLHTGILPHHATWAHFFAHLAFVVLDEAHTYRGVFGSHVANVLRRLKRVAHFYGASPQFVLTSATIGNPTDLGERLIEEPVVLIDDDGAPRGDKHFVIYNPPIIDPALGLRRSMLLETVRLAGDLLEQDVQTILFARSRRTTEVLLRYLQALPETPTRERGGAQEDTTSAPISAYRSGYLPRERRAIERGLRAGSVRAVVATTALELGIDIGSMDAALLAGYPGTIAGTWQQAGRAGRQTAASLAAMVASPSPLDQFLARHPEYFFGRSPEHALINPDNLLILFEHLRCAAFELPFRAGEAFGRVDGAQVAEYLQVLQQTGVLHHSGGRYYWMSERYPAGAVSLRSTSPQPVILQHFSHGAPTVVGEVDNESAPWMVHPGAVYLHAGQQYLVEELDLEAHTARLRPVELDYYTQPQNETQVQLVQETAQSLARGATKAYGEIKVIRQVVGFRQVQWFTHEQLGQGEVHLPPTELLTTGYWLSPSETTIERLRQEGLWNSDRNDYGPLWAAQRDAARARDGYRCQVCGAPEQDEQHHVHHKRPFRTFDSSVQANRLDNLITLCPRCHHRAELAVRVQSGLGGLAFVLGHLAPLFLMCDAGDVGVHADPNSPLIQGQPAVVIYDGVPAGIGFSERLYELHESLMDYTYQLVSACPCTDGCPSCIGPAGENGAGAKAETLALLAAMAPAFEGREPGTAQDDFTPG